MDLRDPPISSQSRIKEPRWPSLFLIGAPKCGTTAMSHYLQGHPQIYMSESSGMKEPNFFNSDLSKAHDSCWYLCRNEDKYLSLFASASKDIKYLGEASVFYLYSKVAVAEILKKNAKARFVVMVRNPIELAASLYNQNYKNNQENVKTFSEAWYLQYDRLCGKVAVPKFWSDRRLLLYGEIAKTGEQLERVLDVANRDRVCVVIYDDFARNPRDAYLKILDFLGLEDDARKEFPVLNPHKNFRIPSLEFFLQRVSALRQRMGIPGGWGLNEMINRFNVVEGVESELLSPTLLRDMSLYFRDDVKLLSSLLGRDLSAWLDV